MKTKQLLPLWYYGLEEEERKTLCSSENMIEVGGVQIPLWFWERARQEAGTRNSKLLAVHAVSPAFILAPFLRESTTLWKHVCDSLDEAFLILYVCSVEDEGALHDDAYIEAAAALEMLSLDSILPVDSVTGVDLPVTIGHIVVQAYLSLRDKAEDGTLTPEDLKAGACFSPEAGEAEESPAKS